MTAPRKRPKYSELSEQQREHLKAYRRERWAANAEVRRRQTEADRKYRLKKPKPPAVYTLEQKFATGAVSVGVSPTEVLAKFHKIGNVCEACGYAPSDGEKRVAIDHDHDTGKFRGFLCTRCNLILGYIETGDLVGLLNYYDRHLSATLSPMQKIKQAWAALIRRFRRRPPETLLGVVLPPEDKD